MKLKHLISIISLIVTTSAISQNASDAIRIRQNESGFGARTLAMGGNGIVTAKDYSAIYWNPAGLASLKHSEFMGELSHLQFSNEAVFANTLSDMEESFTRLRTAGLAISLPATRGSLVFALGYNFIRSFDDYLYFNGFNSTSNGLEFEIQDEFGNYDWYSFDRNVHQTEEVTSKGGLHQWSFGGAIAVSPNLDLGATLNFWNGKEEYSLRFEQEDIDNLYSVFPGDFDSYALNHNLVTNYKALSLKLGSIMKVNRAIQLGLSMEFPTSFRIIEYYNSNDELVFDDGFVDDVEFEPGEWEYKVKTPYRFDAGIGIQSHNINFSGSITYRDWSQTRFEKPQYMPLDLDYSALLDENRILQQEYRETLNYHLGGEILIPNSNLFLRGGYAVYPSPIKNAIEEMDKIVYSGGIGFKIGNNTYLDITYLRSNWQRESEDIYTPGGTFEEITENQLFLGLKFKF